jgi:hypothetical protein
MRPIELRELLTIAVAVRPVVDLGDGRRYVPFDGGTFEGRGGHAGDVGEALARYEATRRPATAAIVAANRGLGPEVPMQLVEERAPDGFGDIADVITEDEIAEVTEGYRRTAGFALAALQRGTSLLDEPYA